MKMSEANRIRWLQGTDNAPRVTRDSMYDVVVKLYEPLLPHTVIFGLEKTWAALIGRDFVPTAEPREWLSSVQGLAHAEVVTNSSWVDQNESNQVRILDTVQRRRQTARSDLRSRIGNFFGDGREGRGGSGGSADWSSSGSGWNSGGSSGRGSVGGGTGGGGGSTW